MFQLSARTSIVHFLLMALVALFILILGACGGSTPYSSAGAGSGVGQLVVRVAWPQARLIPSGTQSVKIAVQSSALGSAPIAPQVIARPAGGPTVTDVSFSLSAAETYELRITAHPEAGGVGTPLASQTKPDLRVQSDRETVWPVTMDSTIHTLTIEPTSLTLAEGNLLVVTAIAKDAGGNAVLLAADPRWESSDSAVVQVERRIDLRNDQAKLTGLKAGQAQLQVFYDESGKASTPVMVQVLPNNSGGTMQNLGTLGGSSSAQGVSADGNVVVGESVPSGGSQAHAFRWTATGGMTDLGTFGGASSSALAASADGSVVVGWAENGQGQDRAFRWTAAGGLQDLGPGTAHGVSADGSVVVGVLVNAQGNSRAFRWTATAGRVDLGTLGGAQSGARGVSYDGNTVVGWAQDNLGTKAFRWTAQGGMEDLGRVQGGIYFQANAVSGDGQTAVGLFDYAYSEIASFRWSQSGGMVLLPYLTGYWHHEANAVSESGDIIVGLALDSYEGIGDGARAFFWTPANGISHIGTLGGNYSTATGISADGSVIVGGATTAAGQLRAFRWVKNN